MRHHHHQHQGCGPRGFQAISRGFGRHFGRAFAGEGFGERGGRRRMFDSGELRLVLLKLISDQPRHGYDLIRAIEELTGGAYAPSPGVVYPTLTYLEEVGFATSASEGSKKVYSITDTGRQHLAENRDVADMALSGIEKFGQKMSQARRWWDAQTRGEDAPAAGDRDIPGVIKEVNEARRALKTAIAEKLESSEDEQRRVAAILQKAADDIRNVAAPKKPTDDIDLG